MSKALLFVGLTMSCALLSTDARARPRQAVSMVAILANEERYVGREIRVFGYLDRSGLLYLTRDHADANDTMSSVGVSDPEGEILNSTCIGSYVRVYGRLEEGDPGSYSLVDITGIYQPSSGQYCWGEREG